MNHRFSLLAPLSGIVIPIEKVPDPVFSEKVMGPGIAIDPTTNRLKAPCDGVITYVHPARHALTLKGDGDGPVILLHIGLDTVNLKGEGFTAKVTTGQKVKTGETLIEFDTDAVAQNAKSLQTVMVITEPAGIATSPTHLEKVEAGRDILLNINQSSSKRTTATDNTSANSLSQESKPIEILFSAGLHARPAAQLAHLAKGFESDISLRKNNQTTNAKSLVSILGLEVACGDMVTVIARGTDADAAVQSLSRFLMTSEPKTGHEEPQVLVATEKRVSNNPNILLGKGISPGLAVGKIQQLRPTDIQTTEKSAIGASEETLILNHAIEAAIAEIRVLTQTGDATRSGIFSAHLELLQDPEILDAVISRIQSGKTAAFAWQQAIELLAQRVGQLKNETLAQRAVDLRDVGRRVLHRLVQLEPGTQASVSAPKYNPTIFIAENLTPSDTMQMDRERVSGFCTTTGGATSHVAILARSLGVPAIVGIDAKAFDLTDGTEIVIDGSTGEIRLHPTESEIKSIRAEQAESLSQHKAAQAAAGRPAITRDGQRIEVHANIGSAADARTAIELGADGVGLLRTEFLFLDRETPPTEDQQLQIYQEIVDILGSRPLTIRTLDVGGDKPLAYLPLAKEDNPFLGVRGIRVGLRFEKLLREQLRAILRVKHKGKINVMFPMITHISEFRRAKDILKEECLKLKAQMIPVGIMIEVPASALMAEEFAREVDFFSIGTNDLTQYTLAMDRGNPALAEDLRGVDPSVLKLVAMTVEAARKYGKWVGVCGGWASETEAIPHLLALGIHELSASMLSVPKVKSQVRSLSLNPNRKNQDSNHSKGARYVADNDAVFISPEDR